MPILSVNAEQNIENIVSANITITFQSATDFAVNFECDVEKITLSSQGKSYTGSDIQTLSTTNPEMMGAIKITLKNMIVEQVNSVFPGTKPKSLTELLDYQNNKFYDTYAVNLTNSFFNLNDSVSVYNLINGILDMGSTVKYNLVFKANIGWSNTYKVDLGSDYEFKLTDGKTKGEYLEWTVLNGMGAMPEKEILLMVKHKNPTSMLAQENITIDFHLDATGKKTKLNAGINMKSINISNYDFLPDFVTDLSISPSDGLRLFVKNHLVSWDEIYENTITPIKEKIKDSIETDVFNQTLSLSFSWDTTTTDECINPYNIEEMNGIPAVKSTLTDEEISLLIEEIPSNAFFGLINTGGVANLSEESINFGEQIKNIGYDYDIILRMPSGIELDGDNNYTWNANKDFSGNILSEKAPGYKNQEINTVIDIEIESVDLNLLSFFTGNPQLIFGYDTKKVTNYNVTELPEEFSLPNAIDISYLNSDSLRVCIDENVFKESEVAAFLNNEKADFEGRIKRIVPGIKIKGNIDNNKFEESLQWDQDISNMDGDNPVATRTYAYTTDSSNLQISLTPPSFKIPDQNYDFSGIDNQTVTYRITFPKGISIEVKDESGKTIVKQTNDEKQYLEVTFKPGESGLALDASCVVTPSLLFLLGLFTPCIISIIITIILIIVLMMFRKKRKGGKIIKSREPTYEEDAGYENHDYYIPPPPGSK